MFVYKGDTLKYYVVYVGIQGLHRLVVTIYVYNAFFVSIFFAVVALPPHVLPTNLTATKTTTRTTKPNKNRAKHKTQNTNYAQNSILVNFILVKIRNLTYKNLHKTY